MKLRCLSSVVAEAILVLITVASIALLYVWISGSVTGGEGGHVLGSFSIDSVLSNVSGVYVWLHGVSGEVVASQAYLLRPGGSLVAVLDPVAPRYVVSVGQVVVAHYVPRQPITPGTYLLRVPGSSSVASSTIMINRRLGEGTVFHIVLNSTGAIIERVREGYNISLSINSTNSGYKITVSVCPRPGYEIRMVSGIIYNSSLRPPLYVGRYYIYVDDYSSTPLTYPDCDIEYWVPLYPAEEPYHVAIIVDFHKR